MNSAEISMSFVFRTWASLKRSRSQASTWNPRVRRTSIPVFTTAWRSKKASGYTRRVLSRPHVSIRKQRPGRMKKPDPSLLVDVVAPKVLDAWKTASAALARAGVRHLVIGGLAVGANGYPRATRDVDFLVGDEAFTHHPGGLVTMNPALPIEVNDVPIDYSYPRRDEGHLSAALAAASGAFVDVPRLIYMKLKASRLRDRGDVVGLLNAGLDVGACRAYLTAHAPDLIAPFDELVARAEVEE